MDAYLQLLLKLAVSIVSSLIVLYVLSRPLSAVLERLCPDADAAAFWQSYTRVMLTIAPLLLVLLTDLFAAIATPIAGLRLTLLACLTGLAMGLYSVGKRLTRFIAMQELTRRPE